MTSETAYELSSGQQRWWFSEQMSPEAVNNDVYTCFELIPGEVDAERLAAALSLVAGRHDILRTVYPPDRARPEALVLPGITVTVDEVSLGSLAGAPTAAVVDGLRRQMRLRRAGWFRNRGLPLAVLRARVGDREFLMIAIRHIAVDAHSEALFLAQVEAAYSDLPGEPGGTRTYAQWAAAERDWLASPAAAEARDHWRATLARLGPPLRREVADPNDQRLVSLPITVGGEEYRKAMEEARGLGVSATVLLLARFHRALARAFDRSDFAVGTLTRGRLLEGFDDVLGFFVNTVPIVASGADARTCDEATLVDSVGDAYFDAIGHSLLPFQEIVRAARRPQAAGGNPLIEFLFSLQGTAQPAFTLGGAVDRRLHVPTETIFDGVLELWTPGTAGYGDAVDGLSSALTGFLQYRAERVPASIAEQVRDLFGAPAGP